MADVNISKYTTQVVREGSKPAAPGFVVSEGQDPVNPPGTNNYVPYTGATANVELGEYGLETGFVNLDTTPTNIPTEQGAIYWDDSKSTAALIMNGTLQHIGQDVFYYVKNSTGSSIPKGTAVRFNGTDGASGHLKIAPFLANGTYPSSYFMGVTAETIANGSFGQVMHFGELSGINTSGYTAGALLYASTTVAGGFQTTAPVAPNNIVLIAAAVNSKSNGEIVVRPQIGSNINQDEGVKITSPTTGDLLQLQAGGLWENKTVAQVIGSAYVPSTRTITINGTTQDLSANRTYNVGTVTSVGLSSATSGVTIGSTPITGSGTITIAIATATATQNGLLSSTDWNTFNSKQNALTLTTTGTSGAATLVGSTLNIPIYSPDLSGYVPTSRTLTINGTTFDLSANRSWSVGTVTSVAALTLGTSGTDLNSTVANGTTTPVITLNVPTASATNRGALSAADWTTFNNKQNALTNPVTGTGTSGQVAYFNGTTTITSESNLFWDATNDRLGIGTSSPLHRLQVTQAVDGSYPTLGTGKGALFIAGDTNLYGLYLGINTTDGNAWMQAMRNNTATAYNLVLQPAGGNLLVGTTTDSGSRLNVNGRIQGQEFFSVGSLNDTDGSFLIDHPGVQTWKIGITNNNSSTFSIGNDNGGSFAAKYFNITNNGNVGIGTTSPQVAGGGFTGLHINGSGNGASLVLSTGGTNLTYLYTLGTGGIDFAIENPGAQIFRPGGSERMRITSTGSVIITADASNEQFVIKRASNTNAQLILGYHSDGYSRIQSVEQNVAYRPLVLNQSGGNVLIGTTTDNSNKLRVNGVGFFDQGVRTGQPVGTTTNNWLLGRALASGTSTPDRWIRVQIGLEYYDILAVYMGTL